MKPLSSSFRDDAGYLAVHEGALYRFIRQAGRPDYDLLMSSGLYDRLANAGKLVAHEEIPEEKREPEIYKILKPKLIPFISYPYEWSFSQLKDAALSTLDIQQEALNHGLSLKDASFFNVQFIGPKPVFIDICSFEKRKDSPWEAYRQFCQHFLGPLVLMAFVHPAFNRHLTAFIDGLPLDLVSKILPLKCQFKPGVWIHLKLHARCQKKHAGKTVDSSFPVKKQLALVDHLRSTVAGLSLKRRVTPWSEYVTEKSHYSDISNQFKKEFVDNVLEKIRPEKIWDLGGNTGEFSRMATNRGCYTVCFDSDPLCVDSNYQDSQKRGDSHMHPLLMDLANPSPSLGWGGEERLGLIERGPSDLVMALALIHHLRITANIPLEKIADFFSRIGRRFIVEFVPKEDPMVSKMLGSRKDIFHDYSVENFESVFSKKMSLQLKKPIPKSLRTLYYFETT